VSEALEPSVAVLAAALLFDLALGEPPNRLHPVVWMGAATSGLERFAPREPAAQLLHGAFVALSVPLVFAAGAAALVGAFASMPWMALAVATVVLKTTVSVRSLGAAAYVVRDALARGDLAGARLGLRSLCSRDPAALDESALAAATIESVAENASDSVVAPLFYYALFGLPAAVFYRAVNTLDAMIGYHGEHEYLGKMAARLDDALGFVPARLTAAALLLAGLLTGAGASNGWRILRRDGAKTESPNAGRPMAAMAGLLRVELAKAGHYRLGDAAEPIAVSLIDRAWRLVSWAVVIAALSCALAIECLHA